MLLSETPDGNHNHKLESKTAQEILTWALAEFRPRIALAASLGAEDVVVIDMLMKLNLEARVFMIDTGRLPPETYSLMEAIRERYGLVIEVYCPGPRQWKPWCGNAA